MAKQCAKCCEAINGIDYVVCRGYCGAFFHMNACSNVTRALQSNITTNRNNLLWMCDKCADLFENSHFRAISTSADQKSPLNTLTTAITELHTEIKKINSKPNVQFSPAANWPIITQRRATKRPLETIVPARASENCCVGSKQPLDNVVSVLVCKNEDPKFWLYLSRIRPDVSIEVVSAMVKANMDIDDNLVVVKLIPKEKDITTLTFVSFKVGLDPSMKSKALDPETWPQGVLFREFDDYGSQKFRFPPKYKQPATPSAIAQTSSPATPVMDLN